MSAPAEQSPKEQDKELLQEIDATVARVQEFFEGIDISVDGYYKKGLVDIIVDKDVADEGSRRARASVNGILVAEILTYEKNGEGFEFYPGEPELQAVYKLEGISTEVGNGFLGIPSIVSLEVRQFNSGAELIESITTQRPEKITRSSQHVVPEIAVSKSHKPVFDALGVKI